MDTKKTFREVALAWSDYKRERVKFSTHAAYALTLHKHLLPAFGEQAEVSEEMAQAFVRQMTEAGLSPNTIKGILAVLKMVMRYGQRHYGMNYYGWDIRMQTGNRRDKLPVMSAANSKALLQHIRQHLSFSGLGIYICLTTGMRIGEICALRWENIDVENGMIYVTQTMERVYVVEDGRRYTRLMVGSPKTMTSVRDIPMSGELRKLLRPLQHNTLPDNYLLTNDTRPIEPRTYRDHFKKLLRLLGIPAIRFHGLRHSFATRCIENRCDYKTVSAILGHANISTTLNLYVHPDQEQKRKCINKVFRALGE